MRQYTTTGRALFLSSKSVSIFILAVTLASCKWPLEAVPAIGFSSGDSVPTFTSPTFVSREEGSLSNVYTATADDPDNDPLEFSLSGGADRALFNIESTSGNLSFITRPDFENPADDDRDNRYRFEVQVEDSSGQSASLTVTVEITNINEAPIFTSASLLSITENSNVAYTATAIDPDFDALSYSIAGGQDQASFVIGAASGELILNSLPDFENPQDSNGDNDYVVDVEADDGSGGTSRLTVTFSVTDVSRLEVEVSFPTANANLGGVSETVVTGSLVDLEDGIVEFNYVNRIEVNGQMAIQSLDDPGRWSAQIPASTPDDTWLIVAEATDGGSNIMGLAVKNEALIVYPDLIEIDTSNDRALVVDSAGLGTLVSVDLTSGARTVVADANIGSGPQILLPESIALDTANNRLLAVDSILDAVLSLDLTSGDRSLISDINTGTGPSLGNPLSMALDATNNRALSVDADLEAVVSVDLTSGNRSVVSDANVGTGPALIYPTAVVLDADNNRALDTDVVLEALVAVNLATGDRTVVADANTGAGIDFPISMVFDAADGRVLVADVNVAAVISIDLLSGVGTVLSDDMLGGRGRSLVSLAQSR